MPKTNENIQEVARLKAELLSIIKILNNRAFHPTDPQLIQRAFELFTDLDGAVKEVLK